MNDTIESFMTESVFTINTEGSLNQATELMRAHHIRHLPVLHGGTLVGILTERDVALVKTLDVDPSIISVEDAMAEDVFAVSPTAKLTEVARRMAKERLGSAVVLSGRKVVGIFTAVDALRSLDMLLSMPSVVNVLNQAFTPPQHTPS